MLTELATLPAKAIDEFKQLYEAEFSEEISDDEAKQKAYLLYQLMGATHQPIKEP